MAVLVVILIVLAVIGAASLIVARQRKPGNTRAIETGFPPMALINPPPPAHRRSPGFVVQHRPNPGFTIVSVTGQPPTATPFETQVHRGPVPQGANGVNFNVKEVSQNLTAICSLTGRTAAACGCLVHKGSK